MGWEQRRRPLSEYLTPATRHAVLTAHYGVCHICGHPGAEQVDHVIPWSQWAGPGSAHHPSNLAPAHGENCTTCGRACHPDKTEAERLAGIRARKQAKRRPPERHPGAIT